MFLGNYAAVGSTVRVWFNTHEADGTPATLSGSPAVRVYKASGTTEDDSGITLTVDFDSRTGLNLVAIDTSADATFYATDQDFAVVITAGTVDSVSVAGTVVGTFSLGTPVAAANPVPAYVVEGGITEDSFEDGAIAAAAIAANALTETKFHVNTGLRPVRSNTATAGASGTITLDFSASSTDDTYNGCLILLTGGTGAGQARLITDYAQSGKVASVSPNWTTNPSSDTTFSILPAAWTAGVFGAVGSVAAGGITAASLASDTITAAKIADGAIDAATFAAGAITAAAIAADAIGASELAADAVTEIQNGLATAAALTTLSTRLAGLVLAQGTIGATGNDATHLHLTGLTYGDDEVNDCLLVVLDVSAGEYHARWVEDWADTGDLATVATLPFTPQNSTDTYWLLPVRQDVTGGSGLDAAGVRAAVGLASANLDTQLGGIQADTDNLQTRVPAALVSGRMDCSVGAYQSGQAPLQPTTAGRTLDVTAGGAAGVDWGNVENGTAVNALSGTSVGSIEGNVEGDVVGSVLGEVEGAVGSVAAGGITAAAFAANSVTASALAADAVAEIQSGLATAAALATVDDFLDTEVAAIKAKTDNLPAAFPANFADLAITASTGRVTVGTNADKTGYSIAAGGLAACTGPSGRLIGRMVDGLWCREGTSEGWDAAGDCTVAQEPPATASPGTEGWSKEIDADGNVTAATYTPVA